MAEIKWIKLNVDMFDDEKIKIIQAMPDGDAILVIWIKLITLAGKTNDGGYIYISDNIPYTDEMLSIIMNKPIMTIKLAMETFTNLQMIESDTKGIYLVNFEKHQSLEKMELIKEQNRIRQQKARDRKLLMAQSDTERHANVTQTSRNVTRDVTQNVTQCHATDIEEEKEEEKEKEGEKKRTKKELQFDIFEKIVSGYKITEKIKSKMYEWLEYKAEINDQYKEQGMKALLRKVETEAKKHGDDAICEIIDESMSNGYKGIIFDKLKKRTPQHNGRTAEEKNDGFCFNPDEDDLADLF